MRICAKGEDVTIRSLTNDQTILVLAGPNARQVLSDCARGDWSKDAFPWLSVRECFIGFAPATVMSVSFSGELAYEIHVPNASLYAAYLAIREAGNPSIFRCSVHARLNPCAWKRASSTGRRIS